MNILASILVMFTSLQVYLPDISIWKFDSEDQVELEVNPVQGYVVNPLGGLELHPIAENVWLLEGDVAPGDCEFITPQLVEGSTLILQSLGGSAYDGICLSITVRDMNINTMVTTKYYDNFGNILYENNDLHGWAYNYCMSACSYIFIGGVERTLSGNVDLGFHRPTIGANALFKHPYEVEGGALQVAYWITYMLDYNEIYGSIRQPFFLVPPWEMYNLRAWHFIQFPDRESVATKYVKFWGYTN